jgi:hypothetical protein
MGFKGHFELVPQKSLRGGLLYSFVLKNTDFFGSETIDCMIGYEGCAVPFIFRDQKLKAGRSYRFDLDTVNWNWHNHDFFAIIDEKGKILKKWELNLKEYAPGECPECHGTMKCRKCNGTGFVYPQGKIYECKPCDKCGATGICQTCFIPEREYHDGDGPTGIGGGFK